MNSATAKDRRQSLNGPSRRTLGRRLTGGVLRWVLAAALLVLGLLVVVQVTFFSGLDPGNAFGLAYGIAAASLLGLAMAYGVRRRFMKTATRWRLGRAEVWLRFHLALGVLFLALTLVHGGLRLPRGVLTWWLLILSVWIVATGMLGWFLQRWVPKALSGLETEVLYERIPELCQSLKERAALLVAGGEEPVRLLYQRLLEPELAEPHRRFRYLVDVQGGRSLQWREIAYLGEFLAAGEKERLTELEAIARTKVELDAHYTLQPLLRWWLALHLPPAIALAGLVGVHIATVVYY